MSNNELNKEHFADHILVAIEQAIYDQATLKVDSLLNDPNWQSKIRNILTQEMVQKLMTQLSLIDFNHVIATETRKYLVERHEARLPDSGLVDQASSVQLSLLDDSVVVENALITKSLEVLEKANITSLTVDHIELPTDTVDGIVNRATEHVAATLFDSWATSVLTQAEEKRKDAVVNAENILLRDRPLINKHTLHSDIRESSLTKVGELEQLLVKGETSLRNTLYVDHKRIGVNTENPDMALTVWDNEVAMSIGKLTENTAYIGTSRSQSLMLGVNRKGVLEIKTDGTVHVQKLAINNNAISFASTMPSHAGQRGELVFNSAPAIGQPFGWQCLGGTRWRLMKD